MLQRGHSSHPAGAGPLRARGSLRVLRLLRVLIAMPLLLVMLAGCGSAEDPGGGPDQNQDGPRVADARFEGDFLVSELSDGSGPVTLSTTPALNFETVFGGLTVKPGCNTYFGSFTLAEDGAASITVAGGSSEDCGALNAQETVVLEALEAVTSWTEVDGGFRLKGSGVRSVLLRR